MNHIKQFTNNVPIKKKKKKQLRGRGYLFPIILGFLKVALQCLQLAPQTPQLRILASTQLILLEQRGQDAVILVRNDYRIITFA